MTKRPRPQRSAREFPRTARLNRLFQQILAETLEHIDDDRLEMVTVMSVDCDSDLRHATVFYDTLAGEEDDEKVLQALHDYRHRLQGAIGSQARVKRTPELIFKPDEVARGAARVEEVLRRINDEER